MEENKINKFKDALQEQMDKELDEIPTFSEEMAEHIRKVYADLWEQKRKWEESFFCALEKNKNEEQS